MLHVMRTPRAPLAVPADPQLVAALEQASGAIARLDQALADHPLTPAFLHRARLEAARRQAAVDGRAIDPWHLAASIEGLRLRMDHALRIVDRAAVFDAARAALGLHQWMAAPDFDQEGEVQAAEQHLAGPSSPSALLSAAAQTHAWLHGDGSRSGGGRRAPMRAALIRFWVGRRLLRVPVPLTGPRALAAEAPEDGPAWACWFLEALAEEASDYRHLLSEMERGWLFARARAGGRRSTSRAAAAVDVLAAAPLLSATTLAAGIGMSIKCAGELLEGFVRDGIAVEVTHRAKRRLYGLAGLAPLRDGTTAPRRSQPGRDRGRPPAPRAGTAAAPPPPLPLHTVSRFDPPAIDRGALDAAIAECERAIRSTRRALEALARP